MATAIERPREWDWEVLDKANLETSVDRAVEIEQLEPLKANLEALTITRSSGVVLEEATEEEDYLVLSSHAETMCMEWFDSTVKLAQRESLDAKLYAKLDALRKTRSKARPSHAETAFWVSVDRAVEMEQLERLEQTEEDYMRFMYGLDKHYSLSKSRLHPIRGNGRKSVCVIGIIDDCSLQGSKNKPMESTTSIEQQQCDLASLFQFYLVHHDTHLMTTTTTLGVEKEEDAASACEGEYEYCDQNGFWSILAPFQERRLDLDRSGFVSVGPSVYCLAGFSRGHVSDQVHVLSLDDDNKNINNNYYSSSSWTLGPCMICPRVSPVTVVVREMIFAFGGVDPDVKAWAEVLDTTTTNPPPAWKALASPPTPLVSRGLFAVVLDDGDNVFFGTEKEKENKQGHDGADSGDKTILLGSTYDRVYFTYNIRESMWRTIPWSIPLEYYASDPVAVGHTLFWVGSYFCAFDLRLRVLYWGVVRGLDNHLQEVLWYQEDTCHTPTLHHLGGFDFCLTWFDWLGVQPHKFARLHTTRIRVRIYEDSSLSTVPGGLDAFVVSSHSYLLPRGFRFWRSLLLDGFFCGQETAKEGFVYEDMICLYKASGEIKELEEGFTYGDVGKDSEML